MKIDARGKQCPLPVVEVKKALEQMGYQGMVEVLVDNEIAVQNLKKLADRRNLDFQSEKLEEQKYFVTITADQKQENHATETEEVLCNPDIRKNGLIVVISSDKMGEGDEDLGRLLMKGFLYALTQQETLPETVLLYNGGARMSCEGSVSVEDLKNLEAQGVEILTCGTCLNHYGLTEKLAVGSVTNMYEIAERQLRATSIVRP